MKSKKKKKKKMQYVICADFILIIVELMAIQKNATEEEHRLKQTFEQITSW